MTALQIVLASLCGLTALAVVVHIVRDAPVGNVVLGMLALIEAGLVVHLVMGLVRVFGDTGDVSVPTYIGYLLGVLVVLPLAAGWSLAERTRSGTAVLLIALFLVPFLLLRAHDVWGMGA